MPKPRTKKPETPKRIERTYSDDQVRAALTAYVRRGKYSLAADETGIPWQNIHRWSRDERWKPDLSAIEHAHAREVRTQFGGDAGDFADDIKKFRASLVADLESGSLKPKEKAAALRALASAGRDVAGIAAITTDSVLAVSGPAVFTVKLENRD